MLISIITINLNNLKGLIKTFESVINQSNKDYQFIVIDGGSTDGSIDYIKKNESFFSYWISEPDKGVYHAMNKGLEKAEGDFCIFLNSGDRFYSNYILSEVSNLIQSNYDLVYGLIAWDHQSDLWNPKEGYKPFEITTDSPIPHQGSFFKTSTLKEYGGYNENYKIISDWCVMFDYIVSKKSLKKISLIISQCEKQGISVLNFNNNKKERLDFLFKNHFKLLIISILFRVKQIILK